MLLPRTSGTWWGRGDDRGVGLGGLWGSSLRPGFSLAPLVSPAVLVSWARTILTATAGQREEEQKSAHVVCIRHTWPRPSAGRTPHSL